MITIITVVAIYMAIGIIRVVADIIQPVYTRPDYIKHPALPAISKRILLWFPSYIKISAYYIRYYKRKCKSQGLQRVLSFIQAVIMHRDVFRSKSELYY